MADTTCKPGNRAGNSYSIPSLVSVGMAGNLIRLCITALALLNDDAGKQLALLRRTGGAA
jgi:hypothetical protein